MKITIETLKEFRASEDEIAMFNQMFPGGEEYQKVLDTYCRAGYNNFASWLFYKLGSTDDVLVFDKYFHDESLDIVFAGHIECKDTIHVHRIICSSIHSAFGIISGSDIFVKGLLSDGFGTLAETRIVAGSIRSGRELVSAKSGIATTEGDIEADMIEVYSDVEAKGAIKCDSIKAGRDIIADSDIIVYGDVHAGGNINTEGTIFSRGYLVAGEDIKATYSKTGDTIYAGIKSGDYIKAGGNVISGKNIIAGYNIYAGIGVAIDRWRTHGVVSAKRKPENVISGLFVQYEVVDNPE